MNALFADLHHQSRFSGAELIIDSFAGGGGASTGIEIALGRSPDIAINHSPEAVAMHAANHPETAHYCQNIWQADPVEVCGRRPVGLAWFSPDCKHFSKAKGGKPVEKSIRDLAWVVVHWAKQVRPRVICLENVEEFKTWCPLRADGQPDFERKGETFDKWGAELRRLGYRVEWRELRACDYGAPTIRKRLFLIARCDGLPIVWPVPTHGPGRIPYRTAADIIDWSIPCPSIFERKKPLVEATQRRIAAGLWKFVFHSASPFIIPVTHQGDDRVYNIDEPLRTITTAQRGEFALIAPHITTFRQNSVGTAADEPMHTITANSFVKRPGGCAPLGLVTAHISRQFGTGIGHDANEPLATVTAGGAGKSALIAAFLAQHNGGDREMIGKRADQPMTTVTTTGSQQAIVTSNLIKLRGTSDGQIEGSGASVEGPVNTISAGGIHVAEVRAFLIKYFGAAEHGQPVDEPLHTVTAKPRFGLVTIHGQDYQVVDIGMRMLTPRELFRAQGFPEDYRIDIEIDGRRLSKAAQVRCCGNSVCPPIAAALVRANYVPAMAMAAAE